MEPSLSQLPSPTLAKHDVLTLGLFIHTVACLGCGCSLWIQSKPWISCPSWEGNTVPGTYLQTGLPSVAWQPGSQAKSPVCSLPWISTTGGGGSHKYHHQEHKLKAATFHRWHWFGSALSKKVTVSQPPDTGLWVAEAALPHQHGSGTGIQRTAVWSTARTDPFPDTPPKVSPQGTSWTRGTTSAQTQFVNQLLSITLSCFEPLNSSGFISIWSSELHIWTAEAFTSASNGLLPGLQDPLHHANQELLLRLLPHPLHSFIYLTCFFSQTDWGLTYKVFPHMKAVSHFLMYFNYPFLYLRVLPFLWLLQSVFRIWVEHLSRC